MMGVLVSACLVEVRNGKIIPMIRHGDASAKSDWSHEDTLHSKEYAISEYYQHSGLKA